MPEVLAPGWLARVCVAAREDVAAWPAWLREAELRAAGAAVDGRDEHGEARQGEEEA